MTKRTARVPAEDERAPPTYVFVEVGTDAVREYDPKTGEGPVIEDRTRDAVLIGASEAVEDDKAQGVVAAYLGTDGHYHFLRHLDGDELRKLGLR